VVRKSTQKKIRSLKSRVFTVVMHIACSYARRLYGLATNPLAALAALPLWIAGPVLSTFGSRVGIPQS
jgi:hypothetical protein